MTTTPTKKRRGTLRKLWGWVRAMRRVLRLVSTRDRYLVIGGLFLSSMLELIGLTMIIPLLASASQLRESKGIAMAVQAAFEKIGIPFDPAYLFGIIVIGLGLKALVAVNVMRYVSDKVGDITSNYQLELIRALLRARWGYFIRQPLGRLVHATGPEAAAVGESFQRVTSIIANALQSLLFLILAAVISWPLLIFALVIGLSMLLSFGKMVQSSRRAARRYRERMRSNASQFTDAMIGIKQVRAMGRTERFTYLFEENAKRLAESMRTRVFSSEYAAELQEPIIGCLIAGGFFLALHTLNLSLHEVVIMALLLVRTVGAITPIQRDFQKFTQAYDQYISLEQLMKATRGEAEAWPGTATPTLMQGIALDQVTFGYGDKIVLNGVSLLIPAGKITAIAGPSGVGKSTTVDLIVGLHLPRVGRILLDGCDLQEIDLNTWRRMIGYVPQDVTLFHDTIFQNVCLWEDGIAEEQVETALRAAGAWSFVEESPEGMQRIVGERGLGLSGGQRQRISLARALLLQPRLLILDEATTGLDPETEAEICARIRELCRETGLTVLAISHQPAWQKIADYVHHFVPPAKSPEAETEAPPPLASLASGHR